MSKKKIALILGIRPDVIRASLLIKLLKAQNDFDLTFIWSGQHYSENLKDVFFKQLDVAPPDIELNASGTSDAEIVSSIISKLSPVLKDTAPEAVIFLGDTNTVAGCLAAAQLNIPIIHIEGCMRSYDWRMPEEKYRTMIDHLSDVIYAYFEEYKQQGILEGLNQKNIVVVGNLIVDVLNEYYFKRKKYYDDISNTSFFSSRNIEKKNYYLMTCHRRENLNEQTLKNIFSFLSETPYSIYFPAGYRTQSILFEKKISIPQNVILVDPIGYEEMLCLMTNSRGIITDSGTVVEEACVLQIPSIQMRKSTERPQVYDVGSSAKFDPALPDKYPSSIIFKKLDSLYGRSWKHTLGDGRSSQRIAQDLHRRIIENDFNGHRPEQYHVSIERSYREDGL